MRRAISKFLPGIALPLSDAPLTARINHSSVEDFYILLDNPYKAWQPGDEISGQVMLISRKNLANIAITLSLSGYIKVNGLPLLKLRPLKQVLLDHSIQIFGPDAALAPTLELFNGLYKAELIHRRAPWRTREAVELATLNWVHWFNHHPLMESLGYIPPAEAEANFYSQSADQRLLAA